MSNGLLLPEIQYRLFKVAFVSGTFRYVWIRLDRIFRVKGGSNGETKTCAEARDYSWRV